MHNIYNVQYTITCYTKYVNNEEEEMKNCTEMNNSVGQAGVHTVLFM